MVQSISPPFTPHYPWLQGEPLFANELNAAIANASSANPPGTYSLFDFGGRSDGVTDDSAAMNAAIAAILARGTGGKLIIAAGRTLLASAISASIPAGKSLTIEGMGPTASELYFPNATDGLSFKLLYSGGTGGVWGSVSLHAFSVIRGPTGGAANVGINLYADPLQPYICGSGGSFRDLIITGSTPFANQWLNSMTLQGVGGCSIDNVTMQGVSGTNVDGGDALMTITGILSGPGTPTTKQFATNNNIVNCTLQGGSVGLLVSGYVQGVALANTTVIGQYDSVRWLGGAGLFAEELDITNGSFNAAHRGIYTTAVNAVTITGATILRFGEATPTADWAGIELNQGGFNSITGNVLIGGHVATSTESGIIVSDAGTNGTHTVIGNMTTNLSTPTGKSIWLKGTTVNATVVGNNFFGGLAPIVQDTVGNTILGNTWNGVARAITTAQPMVFTNPILGSPRWFVGSDNATESGSNTGSNFKIIAADDTGALLDTPISIARANGAITLAQLAISASHANDAAAAAAGVQVGGLYRNGSVVQVRVS